MMRLNRRHLQGVKGLWLLVILMSIGGLLSRPAAWAQGKGGVLRIGMTAADIPYTGGQPDQGFEGFRFVGYQLYDPLVRWDLSQGEELPAIVPGLAESWEVRPEDPTKWLFKLHRGVKFHDGSEFNADAVVWNWDAPMPEATTRLAALRTGQVDWIEVPPPDAIPTLRQAGFHISLRPYPHNWTHTLNLRHPSWDNKLVRQAANYAIDREGICRSLLNGTCIPAIGEVYPGHPWFGKPNVRYEYNPAKAKQLLQQAGYDGKTKRVKASVLISTSGSGQMLPLPMNEFVQENLREVGIDPDIIPIEWNALTQRGRQGFQHPDNAQLGAMNISYNFQEPQSAFVRFFHSTSLPPAGANRMPYLNPEVDRLIEAAEQEFDLGKQHQLLAQVHETIVEDAPWVFIVHDLNPRALSSKVKGFVQPQSWFVDLTLPWVEK